MTELRKLNLRETVERDGMLCYAEFSPGTRYRYLLKRIWNGELARIVFVMLNPSTADAMKDDPTIRRCIAFAKSWGYGGISVVNLFGYRSRNPYVLKDIVDPIGPMNDYILREEIRKRNTSLKVVCAWGNHGDINGRGEHIRSVIECEGRYPSYLKLTKQGQPWHPLYMKGDATPTHWRR